MNGSRFILLLFSCFKIGGMCKLLRKVIPNKYVDPTYNVRMLVDTAAKHVDELHRVETRRIDEQMVLHFSYIEQLREAETLRINAIRAVDVAAVAIASEKACLL